MKPVTSAQIAELKDFLKVNTDPANPSRDEGKAAQALREFMDNIIPKKYIADDAEIAREMMAQKAAELRGEDRISELVELKTRNEIAFVNLRATTENEYLLMEKNAVWAQNYWSNNVTIRERQRFFGILEKQILENQELLEFTLQTGVRKPLPVAKSEISKALQYVQEVQTKEAATTLKELVYRVQNLNASAKPSDDFQSPNLGLDAQRPLKFFGIMTSFNYPLALTLAGLCRALLSGNAVFFKPSERGAEWCFVFQSLFYDAMHVFFKGEKDGFVRNIADGLFNISIGKKVKIYERADRTLFIGSDKVGRKIAAEAAAFGKSVIADLGGANFAIIDPSQFEDVESAQSLAKSFKQSFAAAGGQRCTKNGNVEFVIAGDKETKHEKALIDAFESELFNGNDGWRIGGQFEDIDQGPQITEKDAIAAVRHIFDCLREGAEIVILDPFNTMDELRVNKSNYDAEGLIALNLRKNDMLSRAVIVWDKELIRNADHKHPYGKEIFAPFTHYVRGRKLEEVCNFAANSPYRLQSCYFGKTTEKALAAFDILADAGVSILFGMWGKDLSPELAHGGLSPSGGNNTAHGGKYAYLNHHRPCTPVGDREIVEAIRKERFDKIYS